MLTLPSSLPSQLVPYGNILPFTSTEGPCPPYHAATGARLGMQGSNPNLAPSHGRACPTSAAFAAYPSCHDASNLLPSGQNNMQPGFRQMFQGDPRVLNVCSTGTFQDMFQKSTQNPLHSHSPLQHPINTINPQLYGYPQGTTFHSPCFQHSVGSSPSGKAAFHAPSLPPFSMFSHFLAKKWYSSSSNKHMSLGHWEELSPNSNPQGICYTERDSNIKTSRRKRASKAIKRFKPSHIGEDVKDNGMTTTDAFGKPAFEKHKNSHICKASEIHFSYGDQKRDQSSEMHHGKDADINNEYKEQRDVLENVHIKNEMELQNFKSAQDSQNLSRKDGMNLGQERTTLERTQIKADTHLYDIDISENTVEHGETKCQSNGEVKTDNILLSCDSTTIGTQEDVHDSSIYALVSPKKQLNHSIAAILNIDSSSSFSAAEWNKHQPQNLPKSPHKTSNDGSIDDVVSCGTKENNNATTCSTDDDAEFINKVAFVEENGEISKASQCTETVTNISVTDEQFSNQQSTEDQLDTKTQSSPSEQDGLQIPLINSSSDTDTSSKPGSSLPPIQTLCHSYLADVFDERSAFKPIAKPWNVHPQTSAALNTIGSSVKERGVSRVLTFQTSSQTSSKHSAIGPDNDVSEGEASSCTSEDDHAIRDAISMLRHRSSLYQSHQGQGPSDDPTLQGQEVTSPKHLSQTTTERLPSTLGAWLAWLRLRNPNHRTFTQQRPDKTPSPNTLRAPVPPRYHCDACNKTYSTFGGLSKHRQFHCAQHVKKEFACKVCTKAYSSLGALKMHIRTHTLPCKCTVCGKAFSRPWLLQGHVRTHTGEKPFRCSHCGRAFADRSNLRAHLQTHAEVKKYACKKCGKTFSRMSLLNKHREGSCPANMTV